MNRIAFSLVVVLLVVVLAAHVGAVPLGCHFGREQDGHWQGWLWAFNSFFTGGWGCVPRA